MHLSDGKVWKHFNSVHPYFSAELRNVHLGLYIFYFLPLFFLFSLFPFFTYVEPQKMGNNNLCYKIEIKS